jgi:hypothetical protein
MKLPIQPFTRRRFLSTSALAGLAAATPVLAMAPAGTPLALASTRHALPPGWHGAVLVLTGDYLARLGQMHHLLAARGGTDLHLYLDDADAVLFDIARHAPAKGSLA